MRKAGFKTKIEDTFNSFFENETPHEYAPLQNSVKNAKPSKRKNPDSVREPRPVADFLRQALLFFPGTYVLYFISMGTAITLAESALGEIGFRFHWNMIYLYLIGLAAVFLTWHGLGDLKNKKHFVIPASIISAGGMIGAIVGATKGLFRLSQEIARDFEYAIWLLPIGLIVPFLAKGWVDREKTHKN